MEKIYFDSGEIGRIIGKKGSMKRKIQKTLGINIKKNPDNSISFDIKDEIKEYLFQDFLDAIALGFSFNVALTLIKSNNVFKKINIKDFVKSASRLNVVESRVIGKKGKAKKNYSISDWNRNNN